MAGEPRIAVVTGASTGIGRATAEALGKAGFRLVLVSRDPARAASAREQIAAAAQVEVESVVADLALMSEVRRVAAVLLELPRVDVLINGAGAFYGRRQETAEGHERTWALNHLAPFALSLATFDALARREGRIVNLCTRFYAKGAIDFDDLEARRRYRPLGAYATSKLANLVFTCELARRAAGTGVRVMAVQPGDVYTNAAQNSGWALRALYRVIGPLFFLSPERGADTVVWAATAPDVESGTLLHRRQVRPIAAPATDRAIAERLWAVSEAQTGVTRGF